MNEIEIRGLVRDYGKGRGVFGLTLEVESGEALGVLGPNGAGKTTMLRHLMGFLRARQGSVRIGGMDCFAQTREVHRRVGYLPGEVAFPDDMTGREFIAFVAGVKGVRGLGRARDLADRFELDDTTKLRRMSKGNRQKVAIVCAFLQDAPVLLLDEPTSGLDPLMQNRFVQLVQEEHARGKTILLSSHMFEEVERTCGRAAILRDGKLAAVQPLDELRRSRARQYAADFASAEAAAQFAAVWPGAVADGCRVVADAGNDLPALLRALSAQPVVSLTPCSQSLEESFMQYYGRDAK